MLPGDTPSVSRLIGTKGLGRQIIAGHGVGPGPATAADIDILAAATVVLVPGKVAQIEKKFGILPDILKRLGTDVSGCLGEIAARQDIAVDIDQTDQLTSQATLGAAGGELETAPFEPLALCLGSLQDDPVILGRTGGPDEKIVLLFFHVVMPVENILVLLSRDQFRHDILAPSSGHDHE